MGVIDRYIGLEIVAAGVIWVHRGNKLFSKNNRSVAQDRLNNYYYRMQDCRIGNTPRKTWVSLLVPAWLMPDVLLLLRINNDLTRVFSCVQL